MDIIDVAEYFIPMCNSSYFTQTLHYAYELAKPVFSKGSQLYGLDGSIIKLCSKLFNPLTFSH